MLKRAITILIAMFVVVTLPTFASARDVSVSFKTKHYSISGKSARQWAKQMNRRGPYSRNLRRRVWAMATRTSRWKISHKIRGRNCRVTGAKVNMRVTYDLPKLRSTRSVNRRGRRAWNQMYGILKRHEAGHGRLFKKLAGEMHRRLLRLKPRRNCRQLERDASAAVKKLMKRDRRRNDRFELKERPNYRRMNRLIKKNG